MVAGLFLALGTIACFESSLDPSATVEVLGAPGIDPRLGVNVDLLERSVTEERRGHALSFLEEAPIHLVRMPVRWADIELRSGEPDWTRLDSVAADLRQRQVRWIATIETTPSWAADHRDVPAHWMVCKDRSPLAQALRDGPPRHARDLAAFAAGVAERFEADLAAIEVWREPNLAATWRVSGPDPEDYANVLAAVTRAVHDRAPAVPVLSAGLAPTTELGVCALSDLVFLERLARSGALEAVDGVAIQPFGLRDPPLRRRGSRASLDFARAEAAHAVLTRKGLEKPMWSVAYGWRVGNAASPWGGHTSAGAASWLGDGWALARTDWPWLGPMLVWHLDPVAAPQDPVHGFALLDRDGEPTALGEAVRHMARNPETLVAPAALAPTRESRWPSDQMPAALGGAILLAALVLVAAMAARFRATLAAPIAPFWHAVNGVRDAHVTVLYAVFGGLAMLAPWPIATAALVPLAVLAAIRPAIAVAGVAAVAPFWYGLRMYGGPRPVGPVEGMLALAVIGRMARSYTHVSTGSVATADVAPRRTMREGIESVRIALLRLHPLDAVVVAIVAWGAMAPLWARTPDAAIYAWRTVLLGPAIWYALLRIGSPAWRRRATRTSTIGVMGGATVAAAWAFLGALAPTLGDSLGVVAAEGVNRLTGPYASPNNLALLLGRVLPFAAAGAALASSRRVRTVCFVVAWFTGLAFLGTFSRGALLFGLPPTALLVTWLIAAARGRAGLRAVRITLLSLLALAVVVVALALPFARTERVRGALSLAPGSTAYIRTQLWSAGLEMARDHAILGVGPDNFLRQYSEIYVRRSVVQERFLNHPHQLVLDWWTQLGALGLIALALLLVGHVRLARLAWPAVAAANPRARQSLLAVGTPEAASDPTREGSAAVGTAARSAGDSAASDTAEDSQWLIVGAIGLLVYAAAHGLVDNHFFLVDLALLLWLAQAILLARIPDTGGPRS